MFPQTIAYLIVLGSLGQVPTGDTQPIVESPYFPLKVGTTWHYQDDVTVKVTKHETVVGVLCARLETTRPGKPVYVEHITATKDGIFIQAMDDLVCVPPLMILKLPPQESAVWETKCGLAPREHAGTNKPIRQIDAKFVSDLGQIEVPAGKYEVFRPRAAALVTRAASERREIMDFAFAKDVGIVRRVMEIDGGLVVHELKQYVPGGPDKVVKGSAEDQEHRALLLGKWELGEAAAGMAAGTTMEFKKDGTLLVVSKNGTSNMRFQLQGNKLHLENPASGAKDDTEVAKITETLLVLRDTNGATANFRRTVPSDPFAKEKKKPGESPRSTITITFDQIDASQDAVAGESLATYLAKSGVQIDAVTPGTRVVIQDSRRLYGGKAVAASSQHNLLTQTGPGEPMSFSLTFPTPVDEITFSRVKLLVNTTHPVWRAEARDAEGKKLDVVGERFISAFEEIAAARFTLKGPGIASVRFHSDGGGVAGFSAVLLDDLILQTGPPPGRVKVNEKEKEKRTRTRKNSATRGDARWRSSRSRRTKQF